MLVSFTELMAGNKCLLSLDSDNSGQFIFTGKGIASKKQIKKIKGYDEVSMMLYGEHLVKNYKDLDG